VRKAILILTLVFLLVMSLVSATFTTDDPKFLFIYEFDDVLYSDTVDLIHDISIHKYNATSIFPAKAGNNTFVTGRFGRGLNLSTVGTGYNATYTLPVGTGEAFGELSAGYTAGCFVNFNAMAGYIQGANEMPSENGVYMITVDGGNIRHRLKTDSAEAEVTIAFSTTNVWNLWSGTYNSDTNYAIFQNGTSSASTIAGTLKNLTLLGIGSTSTGDVITDGILDLCFLYNGTLTATNLSDIALNGISVAADTTPPVISLYNCTSCSPPDTVEPFNTTDTTPTFKITTNEDALCAIADVDKNYTAMVDGAYSYRNCTNTGGQQHNCTLHPNDALILNETDYVYFGCRDNSGNENLTSTSGPQEISMTTAEVETEGESAIRAGIDTSAIGPSPTIYDNQRVYIRNLNNVQKTGIFDRLAFYGNKRWAFNYITSIEDPIDGLFNITPAFYTAEYQETTYQLINDSVRKMINETYQ